MGLQMIWEARTCDMRRDGACSDIVIEEIWAVSQSYIQSRVFSWQV